MLFIANFLSKDDKFPKILMAESFSACSLEDAMDTFCSGIMRNEVLYDTRFMCFAHYFHFHLIEDLQLDCNNIFSIKIFNELINDYCRESSKLDVIRDMYKEDESLEFIKTTNGKLNIVFFDRFYSLPNDILELLVKNWIKENITFYEVVTVRKLT
jgi:hypothetical protein